MAPDSEIHDKMEKIVTHTLHFQNNFAVIPSSFLMAVILNSPHFHKE